MTTKYITLDAWRDNYVHVHAVKGETAARFLAVTLTGNGAAINLSDKTVAIYYKKPDGTTIFNSGTIKTATAGLVEIPLTAQMSAATGEMQDVEIRVTKTGGGTLKIKGLQITIDDAESYDAATTSTDEYTMLETALGSVTGFASHMASKSNPHAVTAAQAGAVPTTRKVNGKALSADIALDASDVGAVPPTRKINGKALSADVQLLPSDLGIVIASNEWTPILKGVTAVGSPTYVTQKGRYLRVGNLAWINCDVQISALGGLSGAVIIGGLPFTPAYRSVLTSIYDYADVLPLGALAETDGTIRLTCSNAAGSWSTMTSKNITATFHANISGCYEISST